MGKRNVVKGTPAQFEAALEKRIMELGGDVEACSRAGTAVNASASAGLNPDDERYIHTLIGDVETALGSDVDGIVWDTTETAVVATVTAGGEVIQVEIPFEDLHMDFSDLDTDVAYIVDGIYEGIGIDGSGDTSAVESATNTCNIGAKPCFDDCDDDEYDDTAVMSSVDDLAVINVPTWQSVIRELAGAGYEVDSAYRRKPEQFIEAYKNGKTYQIEVTQYSAGDFEVHPDNVVEVISDDDDDAAIEGSIQEDVMDMDTSTEWEHLATKSVPDSDGFSTEYALYYNPNTGIYICMFGDTDVYTPNEDYADWTGETEDEAWEWFNSYEGFDEEDPVYIDEAEHLSSDNKCDICGRPLNEMGTCPVCDDGEEDYD